MVVVGVEMLREGEGPELVVGGGSLDDLRPDREKLRVLTLNKCLMERNTNLHSNITMNFLCSKQSCCVICRILLIIFLLYNDIFFESLTYI